MELFKEIKKNGSARSVRTALLKFSELAAKIRPQKCRPYVENLLPCLVKIARRQEEVVHEALAVAIPRIFQALGSFTQEKEIFPMLKTYIANLFDANVAIRRTTARSLTAICVYSPKPDHFLPWLLGKLLDFLVPICANEETPGSRILGILACIRLIIPEITRLEKLEEETLLIKRFIQIYELCLHYMRHQDHNIVGHALEALQQLLKTSPVFFLQILTSPAGIKHSYIFDSSTGAALASSVSRMNSLVIDEDEENLLDLEPSVAEETPRGKVQIMDVSEMPSPKLENDPSVKGQGSASTTSSQDDDDGSIHVSPDANQNLDPERNENNEDEFDHHPELDMPNPTGSSTPGEWKSLVEFEDIGRFDDADIPLIFCARKIIRSFLLTSEKGTFVPSHQARVSVKVLAFGCLTQVLKLCPKIFLLTLSCDQDEEDLVTPLIRDVINFTSHEDPQIRGCVGLLLGGLLNGALIESGGNLEVWFNQRRPDHDDIVTTLIGLLQDHSHITLKHTIHALGYFLPKLFQSLSGKLALSLLEEIHSLAHSNYWLVRVEICELISCVPFTPLFHLSTDCRLQMKLKDILMSFLKDDDARIRHHAAKALVRVSTNLYSPVDNLNENPVIFEASQQARRLLHPILTSLETPWSIDKDKEAQRGGSIQQNLIFRSIDDIFQELLVSSNPSETSGYLEALSEFAKTFPPKDFAKGWSCHMPRIRKTSNSRSEGVHSSPALDILKTLKDLLLKSSSSHDFSNQVRLLSLSGSIFTGLSQASESKVGVVSNTPIISEDKRLNDLGMDLFVHCVRLLAITSAVLEATPPQNNTPKPAMAAMPSPSLSPIKKSSGPIGAPRANESGSLEKSPKQSDQNGNVASQDSIKKLGAFSHSTHYLKIYDLMKNLHSNHLVVLDSENPSKLVQLYAMVLECLTAILNSSWGNIVGKTSEEFLGYLKTNIRVHPLNTLVCVQAFLRCIFRTNEPVVEKPPLMSPSHPHHQVVPRQKGLFNPCFDVPYNELVHTFHLARDSVSIPERPEIPMFQSKRSQHRVSKTAMFKTISKASDRTSLASCIRLFEPIVIKALKLYTLTTDVNQQAQVLQLLIQLIQLRVNYCLLDSDQIFIGFIQKQLELIEDSQILKPGTLILQIFRFLVLLSYEKYHSKAIIDVAKILRSCEGLFASGQDARTIVLPALIPVAQDLFQNRSNTGGDTVDLESQREVILNMLLKLIIYPEALEVILQIMVALKIEAEEKWRKLSRTLMDVLIPLLASQKIQIDNKAALDLIHGIFSSLCPSSLRPVDPLLSAMLTCFVDLANLKEVERWVGFILVSLTAITNQSPEEGILGRLEELGIQVGSPSPQALLDTSMESSTSSSDPLRLGGQVRPEITFAKFLIQVIGASCSKLHQIAYSQSIGATGSFLEHEISHLLLFVSYMFQSGRYVRVVKAAQALARGEPDENDMLTVDTISDLFLQISHVSPVLTLQWLYILVLMNHCPQGYWSRVLSPEHRVDLERHFKASKTSAAGLNQEIVRTGALVLFCDYLCDNITNVEATSWLVVNYVRDIIMNFKESPVQDFIMSMHSSAASSVLLFQAIASRCDRGHDVIFMKEALNVMDNVHPSHTGKLLVCLVKRFLLSPIVALARSANLVICLRLEHLLKNGVDQVKQCFPENDLSEILELLRHRKSLPRFGRLVGLLNRLCNEYYDLSPIEGEEIRVFHPETISNLKADQDWFISQVKQRVCNSHTSGEVCADLLAHLDYDVILNILNQKDFKPSVLVHCFNHSKRIGFATEKAFFIDAATETLFQSIRDITDNLPKPFAMAKREYWPSTPAESKYMAKLEATLAVDEFRNTLANLQDALIAFFEYGTNDAKLGNDPETIGSIGRFGVLSLELCRWLLCNTVENVGAIHSQICRGLRLVSRIVSHQSLFDWLNKDENHMFDVCGVFVLETIVFDHLKMQRANIEVAPSFKEVLDSTEEEPAVRATVILNQLFRLSFFSTQSHGTWITRDIKDIILAFSRLQIFTTYIRTPPSAWKYGWNVEPSGLWGTHFPFIPVDMLQDVEILREYVQAILVLGWNSKQQFEEIWMSLLGIFSIKTDDLSEEEIKALSHSSALVVQAVTTLITSTMYLPKPGRTNLSKPIHSSRDSPSQFLMSPRGQQLTAVQNYLQVFLEKESRIKNFLKVDSSQNLERYHDILDHKIALGQISVGYIVNAIRHCEDLSEGGDSRSSGKFGALSLPFLLREDCLQASRLDVQSCLHFLFDLYSQWLQNPYAQETPLNLLTETVRSILCLSDLFTDLAHFQWMFASFSELQQAHPVEDEIMNALLNLGLAKSISIMGGDSETLERVRRVLEGGFKRPHLASKICCLHGVLYILQSEAISMAEKVLFIPMTTDYLSIYLQSSLTSRAQSEQHLTLIWAATFYILENFDKDLHKNHWHSQTLQMAVGAVGKVNTPRNVYNLLLAGLERMVVAGKLDHRTLDQVVKLSTDLLTEPNPAITIPAVQLFLACMYCSTGANISIETPSGGIEDPERLMQAMEQTSILFDCIRRAGASEARLLCAILPKVLGDFFPASDVINRVVSEFMSPGQPHQILLSGVLCSMFKQSAQQNQTEMLKEWVLMALPSFSKRLPLGHSVWCLTCFFISASNHSPWLQAYFPVLQQRFGLLHHEDKKLFCLAAREFFQSLNEPSQKSKFMESVESMAQDGNPYIDILHSLR